jgi:hypothetical protein
MHRSSTYSLSFRLSYQKAVHISLSLTCSKSVFKSYLCGKTEKGPKNKLSFLHITARANKAFASATNQMLTESEEVTGPQWLHPLTHLGFHLVITPEAFPVNVPCTSRRSHVSASPLHPPTAITSRLVNMSCPPSIATCTSHSTVPWQPSSLFSLSPIPSWSFLTLIQSSKLQNNVKLCVGLTL